AGGLFDRSRPACGSDRRFQQKKRLPCVPPLDEDAQEPCILVRATDREHPPIEMDFNIAVGPTGRGGEPGKILDRLAPPSRLSLGDGGGGGGGGERGGPPLDRPCRKPRSTRDPHVSPPALHRPGRFGQ